VKKAAENRGLFAFRAYPRRISERQAIADGDREPASAYIGFPRGFRGGADFAAFAPFRNLRQLRRLN